MHSDDDFLDAIVDWDLDFETMLRWWFTTHPDRTPEHAVASALRAVSRVASILEGQAVLHIFPERTVPRQMNGYVSKVMARTGTSRSVASRIDISGKSLMNCKMRSFSKAGRQSPKWMKTSLLLPVPTATSFIRLTSLTIRPLIHPFISRPFAALQRQR